MEGKRVVEGLDVGGLGRIGVKICKRDAKIGAGVLYRDLCGWRVVNREEVGVHIGGVAGKGLGGGV